jgi:hypothetical protein
MLLLRKVLLLSSSLIFIQNYGMFGTNVGDCKPYRVPI